MKSNGSLPSRFREARNKKDFTKDQLERQSGVSRKFISDLEAGRLDADVDIYTIGKLRLLADFLDLDKEEIEKLYFESNSISRAKSGKLKRDDKVRTPIVTANVAVQALALLALAVAVAYLFWQMFTLASSPRLEVVSPKEDQRLASERIEIVGRTTPGSDVTIDGQTVLVDDDGSFRYSANLNDGRHTFNLEARSSLGRTSSLERNVIIDTGNGD